MTINDKIYISKKSKGRQMNKLARSTFKRDGSTLESGFGTQPKYDPDLSNLDMPAFLRRQAN